MKTEEIIQKCMLAYSDGYTDACQRKDMRQDIWVKQNLSFNEDLNSNEDSLSINKKMKDIKIGVENKIHTHNRTRGQEVCVENVVAMSHSLPVGWTERYNYISKMFNAFEIETLKKHNIK